MQIEKGNIYHIYNQGNNRQDIFFERENYLFFLRKIKTYILPYCNILAWCLMPNHFHLMVLVNNKKLTLERLGVSSRHAESKSRTLNTSIGLLLMSYAKAINKREGRSGKLFREETKAECIDCPNGIAPSFFTENGVTEIIITNPLQQYPQICFNYIHQNPVKAGLVKNITDWEFSSAMDYSGHRNGQLINKTVAKKFIDF